MALKYVSVVNKLKEPVDLSCSDSDCSSGSNSQQNNSFYCRLCNKQTTGTVKEPKEEICKKCLKDFPYRMFCKSCKRIFPDRGPFTKEKDRCDFCCEKLEKRRAARKKKTASDDERSFKKKKTIEQEDFECDNYVLVVIKGKHVLKAPFYI